MRVGLVSWWFNRGQATVMRTLRHALDQIGHETYVLARPTASNFERPDFISSDGVWADHDRLTAASASDIPTSEYLSWATVNQLDACFFFQNLDFAGIGALREIGVRTIGTYMWEAFDECQAKDAARVFDVVYAMNEPSASRYVELGLRRVPSVRFAAHPDIAAAATRRTRDPSAPVRFVFMAGYLRARKPLGAIVEGFRRGARNGAELTIKAQIPIRRGDLVLPRSGPELTARYVNAPEQADFSELDLERVRVVTDDLSQEDFLHELQSHDVVIGVSRWEGLGLHLYECEALGMPLLLNDMEPYSSYADEGGRCLLVDSHSIGTRKCGIEIHEPDLESLAAAFEQLSTRVEVDKLRAIPQVSHEQRWQQFRDDVSALLTP